METQNQNSEKRIWNVTDLSGYLYCPRQFYLEKVLGIRKPVSKEMVEGQIIHKIIQIFSDQEILVIERISSFDKGEIISLYNELLSRIKGEIFQKNQFQIEKFGINIHELEKRIDKTLEKEIILHLDSIKKTIEKGFSGRDLWENLSPKYFSEFPMLSESLSLKGKADRILFSDNELIPFELKTREVDRVFESDELQLAAYCLLLEEKFKRKVDFGILEAGNKQFQIFFTQELRDKIPSLINELNSVLITKTARFPSNFAKCQSCKLKKECEENK